MRPLRQLMRPLGQLFVACALAIVAASCADGGSDDGESSQETTTTAQVETSTAPDETAADEEPPEASTAPDETAPDGETEMAPSGTIVVAVTNDPEHFNPGITTGLHVHYVTGSLFNGLVEIDDASNPHPDLAERWEVSDDSTQYTFHLARDVLWHDGEPFTSADVKFTFDEVLLKHHSRTKAGLGDILDSITTPDDHTVVFTFKSPYAALLKRINSTEAAILPKHIYDNVDDIPTADANLRPVGTGPFMLESYEINNKTILVRNNNYFKEGLPLLDRIIFRVIPDAEEQLQGLEQGDVDYIWQIPPSALERMERNDSVSLYHVGSSPSGGFCIATLTFNLDREMFKDIRVRQAIAHAINRPEILSDTQFGVGRVATGPISSHVTFAYSDDVTDYEYDVELANQLLDEAGYSSDGTRFKMDLLLYPSSGQYGEPLKESLSKVGIDVEVKHLPRPTFVPMIFTDRDFDTNIINYCNNSDPSIGVARLYISSNIGDIPFSNGAGYVNPKIDELFAQAASTANTAERAAIYAQIQKIIVDDLPYLWLIEIPFTVGARSDLNDLLPHSGHFAESAWRSNKVDS